MRKLIIVFSMSLGAPAWATTYFVCADGSDGNTCLNKATQCCASIEQAWDTAVAATGGNHTIEVEAGTYTKTQMPLTEGTNDNCSSERTAMNWLSGSCDECVITCDTLPDVSGVQDSQDLPSSLTLSCRIEAVRDDSSIADLTHRGVYGIVLTDTAVNNKVTFRGLEIDTPGGGISVCNADVELDRIKMGLDTQSRTVRGAFVCVNCADTDDADSRGVWVHSSITAAGGGSDYHDYSAWVENEAGGSGAANTRHAFFRIINGRDIVWEDNFSMGAQYFGTLDQSENIIVRRSHLLHQSSHGLGLLDVHNFLFENNVAGGTSWGKCYDGADRTTEQDELCWGSSQAAADAMCTDPTFDTCNLAAFFCQRKSGNVCGDSPDFDVANDVTCTSGVCTNTFHPDLDIACSIDSHCWSSNVNDNNWRGQRLFEFRDVDGLTIRNNTFVGHGYALNGLIKRKNTTDADSGNETCEGSAQLEGTSEWGRCSENSALTCIDAADSGDDCTGSCDPRCHLRNIVMANNILHDIGDGPNDGFITWQNDNSTTTHTWTAQSDDIKLDGNLYSRGVNSGSAGSLLGAKYWQGGQPYANAGFLHSDDSPDTAVCGKSTSIGANCISDGASCPTASTCDADANNECSDAVCDGGTCNGGPNHGSGCSAESDCDSNGLYNVCGGDTGEDGLSTNVELWAANRWGIAQETNSIYNSNISAEFESYTTDEYYPAGPSAIMVDAGVGSTFQTNTCCTTDADCPGGTCTGPNDVHCGAEDTCVISLCASEDIRGTTRSTCDIGAFEFVEASSPGLSGVSLDGVSIE